MDFNALNQKIKECAEFARACNLHHLAAELQPSIWVSGELVDSLRGRVESVQFLVKINKPKNEMGQHFMLALRDLEKILGCEEAGLVKQTKIA